MEITPPTQKELDAAYGELDKEERDILKAMTIEESIAVFESIIRFDRGLEDARRGIQGGS